MMHNFSKKIVFLFAVTFSLLLLVSYSYDSKILAYDRRPYKGQIEIDNSWVNETLSKMSLREKIGQFFMVAAYSGKEESHFVELDSMISVDKIGGLIFFQGDKTNLVTAINRFQTESKIPLLIGMDAEWGVQMRLSDAERFPYNYTIGAANDVKLTEKLASMMGQECRELGIHINFAPVADVNSNPNNPVIGFRSYGENPHHVADHVEACVRGMEGQGVLTSIKHFPGHGDTDVDSHLELPIVNNPYSQINAIDFFPFRSGIRAGASSVMIGHLNVPALDSSGTPSSLSKETIQRYLRGQLGFEGLIISDALGMKAVADRYGKTEVVVKAFEAGCDILLFPETVTEAISAIEDKVKNGGIKIEEIDARCKKILLAKDNVLNHPKKMMTYTKAEISLAKKQLYEKAITVVQNRDNVLPIKRFDQKIAHISIGDHSKALEESMDLVTPIVHFNFKDGDEALMNFRDKLRDYDLIITTLHASTVRAKNDFGLPKQWRNWCSSLPESSKNVLVLFGNPLVLAEQADLQRVNSIVIGYENNELVLDRAGQLLMGTFGTSGKLPMTIGDKYKRGIGLEVESGGRLKESQPEELGIDPNKLKEIDAIVEKSIQQGAFPGCQIVVAIEGKVIYRKSFGHHTYTKSTSVSNDDVYDIASVTKIAASTISLMRMNSQGSFSLDKKLSDYLPDLTMGTPYANIILKKMMAHQAGLKPWIPFYVATLANKQPSEEFYAREKSEVFNQQVAENLWIRGDYTDVIYQEILKSTLQTPKYKYSDIGYYFVKKIIEENSGKKLDDHVLETFYKPMGLTHIRYNPREYFPIDKIPPTENDTLYRKQLIHGYVHDQGASMMGGVGGHAGLFSNASDLAALMQMLLNKGSYGNVEYIKPEIVTAYTGCQYCPTNRRGAGFDKPTLDRHGGPTTDLVSLSSFGHSGFTGTFVWADPEYNVNYVFLSNRVYPDAENWKIVKLNIRTDIQRVIYEALKAAK